VIVAGLALAGTLSEARAASVLCDRFAAPDGHDSNPGTQSEPFRTARRLANSLHGGQTGCLRDGTYDDLHNGYVLRFDHGGTSGEPLTIRSFPGERARLVGTTNIPHGSNHVRLVDLVFRGTGRANTVKVYATGATITRSTLTNAGRGESCLILGSTSGYGRARNVRVARNRFHACGSLANDNHDHAIYVDNAVGTRIVGNVFWSTAAYTIHLYPHATKTLVEHNVIDGGGRSVRGGSIFAGNSHFASSDNVVARNIIAFSRTYNITSYWDGPVGRGNVARQNCIWGGRDGEIDRADGGFRTRSNVVARPMFIDRRKHDYRLGSTSKCLSVVGYDAAAQLERQVDRVSKTRIEGVGDLVREAPIKRPPEGVVMGSAEISGNSALN
jgi:hypothetical protein